MIHERPPYLRRGVDVPLFKVSLPAVLHEENNFGHLIRKRRENERTAVSNRHLRTFEITFSHFHVVVRYTFLINKRFGNKGYVVDAERALNSIWICAPHKVVEDVQECIIPLVQQSHNRIIEIKETRNFPLLVHNGSLAGSVELFFDSFLCLPLHQPYVQPK